MQLFKSQISSIQILSQKHSTHGVFALLPQEQEVTRVQRLDLRMSTGKDNRTMMVKKTAGGPNELCSAHFQASVLTFSSVKCIHLFLKIISKTSSFYMYLQHRSPFIKAYGKSFAKNCKSFVSNLVIGLVFVPENLLLLPSVVEMS